MIKAERTAAMVLTDLPNEVLGQIMDFMSFDDLFRLERVNKRLRESVFNFAWPKKDTINHETIIKYTNYPFIHTLDIYDKKTKRHNLNEKSVELLLSRTKNLKHLDLSFYFDKFTSQITSQFYLVPQLISLDLSGLKLENDYWKVIANSCSLLEKITFGFNGLENDMENGLEFLFKQCKNIKYLNFSGNDCVCGENSFAFLPIGLQYLNLSHSNNITTDAIDFVADRAPNLETFMISSYFAYSDCNDWLRKLEKLRFFEFDSDSNEYPSINLSHMKELEMLRLTGKITDDTTLHSLKSCQKLKGLYLKFYWNQPFDGKALEILMEYKALKYCALDCWENLNNYIVDFVQTRKIEYLSIKNSEVLIESVLKALIIECDSLSLLEIIEENNENFLPVLQKIFSEDHYLKRSSNILKLVIPHEEHQLPICNWCEVISSKYYKSPSPNYKSISKTIKYNKSSL